MAIAQPTDNAASRMDNIEAPPLKPGLGMERRMNIRAFDYWESLLDGRDFPAVGDLDPEVIAPFREHSLLIDFTAGYDAPVMRYIGAHLREEASLIAEDIDPNDVPAGTLLSRLTSHYLEILANRAPIGFEAEFQNETGQRVLYRGILLPLSDDGTTINFIYGVLSWKIEAASEPADFNSGFDDDVIDLDAPIDPSDEQLVELTQVLDEAETDALLGRASVSADVNDDQELKDLMSEIDAVLENSRPTSDAADLATAESDTDALEAIGAAIEHQADGGDEALTQDHTTDTVSFDEALGQDDDMDAAMGEVAQASFEPDASSPVEPVLQRERIEDVFGAQAEGDDDSFEVADVPQEDHDPVLDLADLEDNSDDLGDSDAPVDAFGHPATYADDISDDTEADMAPGALLDGDDLEEPLDLVSQDLDAGEGFEEAPDYAAPNDGLEAPMADLSDETADEAAGDPALFDMLAECQAAASDLARFDSRSRAALYETLSLGYDFHLASQSAPVAYQTLLETTGISMQERAPMTPIVKLIFGQSYDKTRLTEYASALSYADREGVEKGGFIAFVEHFEGGIKAMVKAERAARSIARGNVATDRLEAAKTQLRARTPLMTIEAGALAPHIDGDQEFVLMVARRDSSGGYAVLDAVDAGKSTLEAALKKAAQKTET